MEAGERSLFLSHNNNSSILLDTQNPKKVAQAFRKLYATEHDEVQWRNLRDARFDSIYKLFQEKTLSAHDFVKTAFCNPKWIANNEKIFKDFFFEWIEEIESEGVTNNRSPQRIQKVATLFRRDFPQTCSLLPSQPPMNLTLQQLYKQLTCKEEVALKDIIATYLQSGNLCLPSDRANFAKLRKLAGIAKKNNLQQLVHLSETAIFCCTDDIKCLFAENEWGWCLPILEDLFLQENTGAFPIYCQNTQLLPLVGIHKSVKNNLSIYVLLKNLSLNLPHKILMNYLENYLGAAFRKGTISSLELFPLISEKILWIEKDPSLFQKACTKVVVESCTNNNYSFSAAALGTLRNKSVFPSIPSDLTFISKSGLEVKTHTLFFIVDKNTFIPTLITQESQESSYICYTDLQKASLEMICNYYVKKQWPADASPSSSLWEVLLWSEKWHFSSLFQKALTSLLATKDKLCFFLKQDLPFSSASVDSQIIHATTVLYPSAKVAKCYDETWKLTITSPDDLTYSGVFNHFVFSHPVYLALRKQLSHLVIFLKNTDYEWKLPENGEQNFIRTITLHWTFGKSFSPISSYVAAIRLSCPQIEQIFLSSDSCSSLQSEEAKLQPFTSEEAKLQPFTKDIFFAVRGGTVQKGVICFPKQSSSVNDFIEFLLADHLGPGPITLDLSGCRRVDPDLLSKLIAKISYLKGIYLEDCVTVTDTVLDGLPANLQHLRLRCSPFISAQKLTALLSRLNVLQHLHLKGIPASDAFLFTLKDCASLQSSRTLQECHISIENIPSDKDPSFSRKEETNDNSLHGETNQMEKEFFQHIADDENVRRKFEKIDFDLPKCHITMDRASRQGLSIEFPPNTNHNFISTTISRFPTFYRINVRNQAITDSYLKGLFSSKSTWQENVQEIDISDNEAITDDGLQTLLQVRKGEWLRIAMDNCPRITGKSIEYIAQNNQAIRILSCSNCHSIDATSLISLLSSCSQLEQLYVDGCLISPPQVASFFKKIKTSTSLQIVRFGNHTPLTFSDILIQLFDKDIAKSFFEWTKLPEHLNMTGIKLLGDWSTLLAKTQEIAKCGRITLTKKSTQALTQGWYRGIYQKTGMLFSDLLGEIEEVDLQGVSPITIKDLQTIKAQKIAINYDSIAGVQSVVDSDGFYSLSFAEECDLTRIEKILVYQKISSKNVRKVSIQNHHMSKESMSAFFASFSHLEEIELVNCHIPKEGIMHIVRQYRVLKGLSLSNSILLGSASIETCIEEICAYGEDLHKLELSGCLSASRDSSAIETILHSCLLLQSLSLGNCRAIQPGIFQKFVFPSGSLLCLQLEGNAISDADLLQIPSLFPNIQEINLSRCADITCEGVTKLLKKCKSLRTINLTECKKLENQSILFLQRRYSQGKRLVDILWSYITYEKGFTNEQVAHIPTIEGITNQEFTNIITSLPSYSAFFFSENNLVDDHFLDVLAENHPGLQSLSLHSCPVSNRGIAKITQRCKTMKNVFLSDLKDVDDTAVENIKINIPGLEHIRLRNIPITNVSLKYLLEGCINLRTLAILQCNTINDSTFENINVKTSELTTLSFKGCRRIFGLAVLEIVSKCQEIQCINMENTSLQEQYMELILQKSPKLKLLNISGNSITDDSLKAIPQYGSQIEKLHLKNCPNISVGGIETMLPNMKNLQYLILSDNSHIEEKDKNKWKSRFPQLRFTKPSLVGLSLFLKKKMDKKENA